MTKKTQKLAPSRKLPPVNPSRFTKTFASRKTKAKTQALLGVSDSVWKSWGKTIPPPYSGRLKHSEFGKKPVIPKFVSLEDALIIFKCPVALCRFFGKHKNWHQTIQFLSEVQSYYMLENFGEFVREYTLEDIKNLYL